MCVSVVVTTNQSSYVCQAIGVLLHKPLLQTRREQWNCTKEEDISTTAGERASKKISSFRSNISVYLLQRRPHLVPVSETRTKSRQTPDGSVVFVEVIESCCWTVKLSQYRD